MKASKATPKWLNDNEALDRRMVSAMSRKDVAGVLSCFVDSPQLNVVLWGTEMHGPDELRQALESLFSRCDTLKLTIDRVSRILSGNVVMAVGRATYTMNGNGSTTVVGEVWTDVRRRVNGRWVYVLDHAEVLPGI